MKKLFSLLLILFCTNCYGTHIISGILSYTCKRSTATEDTYLFSQKVYADCAAGIPVAGSTMDIFFSGCGYDWLTFSLKANGGVKDIPLPCITATNTCHGGSAFGVQMQEYTGTVTIPKCDTWIISQIICCRDQAIQTIWGAANANFYAESTLNNTLGCNNSMVLSVIPIIVECPMEDTFTALNITDADGDNITTDLDLIQNYKDSWLSYIYPYSYTQFVLPYSLLNNNVVHTRCDNNLFSAFSVKVSEYRNGTVIATQDVNFDIISTSSCCSHPLPVELLSFTAKALYDKVQIKWRVASEVNNDHFELFKADETHEEFTSVYTVPGKGNYLGEEEYGYLDLHLNLGVTYYKLYQYDYDGNYTESETIGVKMDRLGNVTTLRYNILGQLLSK